MRWRNFNVLRLFELADALRDTVRRGTGARRRGLTGRGPLFAFSYSFTEAFFDDFSPPCGGDMLPAA